MGGEGGELALPLQRVPLVTLRAGAAVAAGLPLLQLGALNQPGWLGEEGCGATGSVMELHAGAQAELHAGTSRFAHPASPLQGAGAVPGIQRDVKSLLLLLAPERSRALQPAAGGARLAGAQYVCDSPQPALFSGVECR